MKRVTPKKRNPKPVTLADVKFTDAKGRTRKRYTARRTHWGLGWVRQAYALYDREKQAFPFRRYRFQRFRNGPGQTPVDYWKIGTKRWVVAYIERTTLRAYKLQRVEDALDRDAA